MFITLYISVLYFVILQICMSFFKFSACGLDGESTITTTATSVVSDEEDEEVTKEMPVSNMFGLDERIPSTS